MTPEYDAVMVQAEEYSRLVVDSAAKDADIARLIKGNEELLAHSLDFSDQLSAAQSRITQLERDTEHRARVSVYGTDACNSCDDGRITLYSHGSICANCRAAIGSEGGHEK